MIRNQRGFTLIELLVTIMILSFIGIIVWNIFIQGNKFTQKSISKNTIQQEANIIITTLTKIHQTSSQYEMRASNCDITVIAIKQNGTAQTQVFNDSRICYSTSFSGIVNPNQDDINLRITLSDKKDMSNKLDVDTILYRLKDGGV